LKRRKYISMTKYYQKVRYN